YVLGTEGGGAFLAGLRYGSGTYYMRAGGSGNIYWHGPSIGTDFGASGSRTMFLIYRLHQPEELYRQFTGVDGSAYFIGGVGVTFLKGGQVMMAPIRTGLGLRLGANIGYIRFTPRATWTPSGRSTPRRRALPGVVAAAVLLLLGFLELRLIRG